MTRPEPTIYGNCERWNFIVGKKPEAKCLKIAIFMSLRASNRNLIHNLFTILHCLALDNLWVICGSTVNNQNCREIEDVSWPDMPESYKKPASF